MSANIEMDVIQKELFVLDEMSKEQFNEMMQRGCSEAKAGIGLSVDEAFAKINKESFDV